MNTWDGKFSTKVNHLGLSLSEQDRRFKAFKEALIVMYCENSELVTTYDLSIKFAAVYEVSPSFARNLISDHKWWKEILRARASGIITPQVKTNWHIEPWNMQASCYS